ncbi:hypothetical protein BCR35DRAFT_305456 [Leucosporidium creatinivorum]|uniref:Transcription elongation factor Eaf N-terminal domain-containing protein n=1 Tax=Leucosporidium creatinivorum TaxID=106004 RepID=A0A1Y2F028_9BASI|nr:hypothetical protein BCR35DRAFT_305456 [Leucosporidium creatinivorum]
MAQVAASAAATASDTLHDIHFGSSFLSASEAGAGASQQDALYSLKYASKPTSLDASAAGTLWADAGSSSAVYAAFPSTSSSSTAAGKATEHRFSGKVESAKEVDCVLIWDEELQSFSLERIDANVRLAVDREGHGGPTPSLPTSLPAPRPPAPSSLTAPGPSKLRSSSRDPDAASSDSQDSEDSEIRVPSVPPAHLRKLASERARQSLSRKSDTGASGGASTSESGPEEDGARGRLRGAVSAVGQPPKKQEPEVEDFGDISFGSPATKPPPPTAVEPKAPVPAAAQPPKPAPLSLPSSRSSTPAGRAPPPMPKPAPPQAPVVPPPAPALNLPKSSPPRPTPPPPQPAPPPIPHAAPTPPPRSSPAQKAPAASKRPPSRKAPSKASKIPASTTADGSSSPKKGRRRSSVAQKSMPLSKATISSSEGSSDGDSDDSSGSGSGSEEEDTGIPEGYLARPGSILSASAGERANARPAARKAPMKAPPAVPAPSDSGSGSGSGSDSDDDESDDMEILASSINNALTGPAVGPGRVQGQMGKGKGGAKRGAGAAASKIPASMGARAAYASKVPASMRSSIASKIPASSSAGARAQKGPVRSGGYDADAARRAADIPDSESEED